MIYKYKKIEEKVWKAALGYYKNGVIYRNCIATISTKLRINTYRKFQFFNYKNLNDVQYNTNRWNYL